MRRLLPGLHGQSLMSFEVLDVVVGSSSLNEETGDDGEALRLSEVEMVLKTELVR